MLCQIRECPYDNRTNTPSEDNEERDERLSHFCILFSQHNVSRSVFTAAGVFDRTSAPAGAGTRVRSAPGG